MAEQVQKERDAEMQRLDIEKKQIQLEEEKQKELKRLEDLRLNSVEEERIQFVEEPQVLAQPNDLTNQQEREDPQQRMSSYIIRHVLNL